MKQKDIALIIIVVFMSAVASVVISNSLITTPKNRQEKVEVVESISGQFGSPNNKYFNDNSINPTRLIKIGDGTNQNAIQ